MTAITITLERSSAVDYSFPYDFDRFGFVSHKSGHLPMSQALLWPFTGVTWSVFFASLISLRLLVQIMHQMEMEDFAFNRWMMNILKAIFLGRSMNWCNMKWSHLWLLLPIPMIFVVTRCNYCKA